MNNLDFSWDDVRIEFRKDPYDDDFYIEMWDDFDGDSCFIILTKQQVEELRRFLNG